MKGSLFLTARIVLPASLILTSVTALPASLRAQDLAGSGAAEIVSDPLAVPRPELRALRWQGSMAIDGVLDEEVWARADSTRGSFIQIQPVPGAPATERTVVRIVYDDDNLYVGAVLYDSEPDRLNVPGLDQDFDTRSSDLFGIALDTYLDHSNGFVFAINPAGAVFDAQTANDQRDVIRAWEGIVEVRTTVHELGWTAEMRIPFATLRYNPSDGEQTWGLNFSRRIRRKNEESNWAPLTRQFRLYKFSLAGTLTGLQGLPHSRNIQVKPYVSGSNLAGTGVPSVGSEGDVGVDAKWGLTPRLTLDLTVNTDFSQVEVDQEQVNLSRFSLFFPEKRDFFLENEGTFAFQDLQIRNYRTGSTPGSFKLFHSRRIGLSADRRPLPILAGARLTGRAGPLEIGLLQMRTRSSDPLEQGDPELPGESFSVMRVRGSVAPGKAVGAMFLDRRTTTSGFDAWHRSYGVDANLVFLNSLVVAAYGARTEADDGAGDQGAAMLQVAWRDPLWDASALFKHVGDGFDPRMGFVDRTGVRRYFATVGAHPQPGLAQVLELNPYVDADVYTDLHGVMESRNLTPGLGVTFMDGSTLTLEWQNLYERVSGELTIAGVDVPLGEYDFNEAALRYMSSGSRVVSGSVTLRRGGFYDGERTSVNLGLVFRPNRHLQVDAGLQHNDLELGGESFTADLYSGRVRYAYDTRTFLSAFVQYNETAEELVSNARFNLIHAPLSDLFLVFTERRSLADDVEDPIIERGVTLKATRLVAF